MNQTFLIFVNQDLSGCNVYKVYQLNTPFHQEIRYTFADGTEIIITDAEGRAAFLLGLWSKSRKSNGAAQGELIPIESAVESEKIVRNLMALIQNRMIELPNAIMHLLHYDSNKEAFAMPFNPLSN